MKIFRAERGSRFDLNRQDAFCHWDEYVYFMSFCIAKEHKALVAYPVISVLQQFRNHQILKECARCNLYLASTIYTPVVKQHGAAVSATYRNPQKRGNRV